MNGVVRKPYRFHEIYGCLAQQLGVKYTTCAEDPAAVADFPLVLKPEMVAKLPEALRQRLTDALTSLDSDHIVAAISEAGQIDASLAGVLTRLAENFDYPAILRAIEAVPCSGSGKDLRMKNTPDRRAALTANPARSAPGPDAVSALAGKVK